MTSSTTDRRLGLTGGRAIKTPCKAATTSNITLSGEQTVDGVSCATGDRVLVKSQTSTVDNGIYVCDTGTWTRDLDFDGPNDVTEGTIVMVLNGSANVNTYWRLTTTGTVTFGSSAITFGAALAGDSSTVAFTQTGTGADTTTAQAKLRQTVSLFDFMTTTQIADVQAGTLLLDVTSAIQEAHDSLPTNGGGLYAPPGSYLATNLAFTKRIHFFGDANLEDEASAASCQIVKKSTATGNLLTLSGPSSIVERIAFVGQIGNAGDGVQLKANGIMLRDVATMKIGGNGIRVGHSDSTNCNGWSLINVRARKNGGEGVYIHSDDSGASINANAGTAINLSCQQNTGKGLRIKNGQLNTFIGVHTESNTGHGIYLEGGAQKNVFLGGDQEGNTAGDISVSAATATDNLFIRPNNLGTFTDTGGARTINLGRLAWGLPQTEGEILGNGPTGGSFSGSNQCYIQLYGDSNGRIRFGWDVDGPNTGLVAAQLMVNAAALFLCSRDVANGRVRLQAGTGLAGYLDLDPNNSKIEINQRLTSTTKISPGKDDGTLQSGGIFMGAGVPSNANGADGDFYFRSDGTQAASTVIYHRQAGAWVALVTT